MEIIEHQVLPNDSLISICKRYNINKRILISYNINRYPKLKENPYMIFQNWTLRIPLINNGGDTQYDLF